MQSVPLVETAGDPGSAQQSGGRESGETGAAVAIELGDGSQFRVTLDEIQALLAAIQTVLLLYVVFKEVAR